MTRWKQRFLGRLAKLEGVKWILIRDEIRGWRKPKDECLAYYYCPITAVAIHETGRNFHVLQTVKAASIIHMTRYQAVVTMTCADHLVYRNGYDPEFRKAMLEVLGL
jgi:hypothetical protein